MKWRWMLTLIALSLLGILAAVAVVAAIVPVNFTVGAPGVVRPLRSARITAAESGLALRVQPAGHVKQGDLLLTQRAETEKRRLNAIEQQLEMLRDKKQHEDHRLEAETTALAITRDMTDAESAHIAAQLDGIQPRLAEVESSM